MIRPSEAIEISEIFADTERVTHAVRQAGSDARLKHKQLGMPLVVWRDGQVVLVPPEEIVVDPPGTSSSADDSQEPGTSSMRST